MTENATPEQAPATVPAITSAPIGKQGIELRDMGDLWSFAQKAIASGFCPNGIDTPEKALIALQIGLEVGLTPMQGLQGTAVINGSPSLYGDVAKGLCLASPKCQSIECNPIEGTKKYNDDYGYRAVAQRVGMPKSVRTFTVADAKLANLWGKKSKSGKPSPWVLYPDRMLMWRAQSWAMRDAFADVLRGIAIYEDVQAQALPPRDVTPTEPQPGGEGSQLAKLLSDPKPENLPDDATIVTGSIEATPEEAKELYDVAQLGAEPTPDASTPEEEAPALGKPPGTVAPAEIVTEGEAPAKEPADGDTVPITLSPEGIEELRKELKMPKKAFDDFVQDIGFGQAGVQTLTVAELGERSRQLLETAIRDYKK